MVSRISMSAFGERFREESWFPKPLDRSWPDIKKKVAHSLKEEMKKYGGAISNDTSTHDFTRFKNGYKSMFFAIVNDLLKKDIGVKNGLYAAMGSGQSQLAAGHVYWMKDIIGDDNSLQAEYNAMPAREQSCATHLQTLTRNLMLYYVETVIS